MIIFIDFRSSKSVPWLSVIIFTGSHLPPPPLWHHWYIYSYHWVQNPYKLFKKPWFDTIVIFYYFYLSPLPTLVHIVSKGICFGWVLLSISSPFEVTKLQKIVLMSHRLVAFYSQCQWTRIFLFLTNPMAMTQLGFKQHRESSRKLWFQHYYQWIFLHVVLL